MADISKIQTKGETYDIKDEEARDDIASLNDDLANKNALVAVSLGSFDTVVEAACALNAQSMTGVSATSNIFKFGYATISSSSYLIFGYRLGNTRGRYFALSIGGDGAYIVRLTAADSGTVSEITTTS